MQKEYELSNPEAENQALMAKRLRVETRPYMSPL